MTSGIQAHRGKSRSLVARIVRVALVVGVAAFATRASAQSVADFYRGKTVRVILPTAPGGDRALYALPVVNFIGRHIPGNPTVIPVFMPGAGGATGVNYLYNAAPPDGLTIATPLAPVVVAQATGDATVKYDVRRMSWLGRTADATRVFFVWDSVKVRALDDLRRVAITVGSSGRSSETYINPAVMNYVLGDRIKIVSGYAGVAEVNLGMERRETDGSFSTWNDLSNTHADWLNGAKVRMLAQIALAKHPALSDIPLLSEAADNDADRAVLEFMSSSSQMGQSFVAHGGTSPEIIEALRRAFDATMKDPDFLAAMRTAKLDIYAMTGEALTETVRRTIDAPASVIDRYKAATAAD